MADGPEAARVASREDAARVAELLEEFAAQLASARGGAAAVDALTDLRNPSELERRLALAGGGGVVVGTYDGVVAGLAFVDELPADGGLVASVRALYVEPEMRRVGVGGVILAEVTRLAEAHGATALEVSALPGDAATKSFLETMGLRARLLVMHRRLGQ